MLFSTIPRHLVHNFMGPFHVLLEMLKCMGSLFDLVLLPLLMTYRGMSEGRVFWVMFPSDPGAAFAEYRLIILAVYSAAVPAATAAKKAKGDASPLLAHELTESMFNRAKECPAAAAILMWLVFAETSLAILDSKDVFGQYGDFPGYLSLLRVADLLFGMVNAYKYVRLVSETLHYFCTCCPAVYMIYWIWGFTMKAGKGGRYFVDQFGKLHAQAAL